MCSKGVPSRGGRGVAAVVRSKDDSGFGDLATKLSPNLCTGQVVTGCRGSFKVSRNTGAGSEGPENGEAAHKRNESLHFDDGLGNDVGKTWEMQDWMCVQLTL